MSWRIVSFYTIGTSYEQEVKKLEASLLKFGLPFRTYAHQPTGTWRGNLNHKSATIRLAFNDFPGEDIVFLDADAVVRQYPSLFDTLSTGREYDIAACFFKYHPRSGDPDELLAGTLWVANNATGHLIVDEWHSMGLAHPEIRHQMCLKMTIARLQQAGHPVRVYRLPFEYTCIFDYGAARGKVPVIEHFQASRRFKREVNTGVDAVFRVREVRPTSITTANVKQIRRAVEQEARRGT